MSASPWILPAVAIAALVLPVTLVAAPSAQKGGKERKPEPKAAAVPFTPWKGRLDAAKERAAERNVPLLVHIVLEDEEANDLYRTTVVENKELQDQCAAALVVIANNGTHPSRTIEEKVNDQVVQRTVCDRYPWFATCAEHQAAWDDLYREFHEENGDLRCPQTVVYAPDGTVAERINTSNAPPVSEVAALVDEAVRKAGASLSEEALAIVKRSLVDARAHAERKEWPQAWRAWNEVLVRTQVPRWADEPKAGQIRATAMIKEELVRLAQQLAPGTAAKAYAEIEKLKGLLAGSPLEKDAISLMQRAEKDTSIQGEIKAWKLSVEADKLLAEVSALFDAKQDAKARTLLKKLLTKRYAGTAAQENARKLWGEDGAGG